MNTFDYLFERSKGLEKDFILGTKSITYPAIYSESSILADHIKERIGENKSVLVLGQNSIFLTEAYLAVLKSGNVCVPLNPKIETENLSYIINECNPSLALVDAVLLKKHDLGQIEVIDEQGAKGIVQENADKKSAPSVGGVDEFDSDRLAEIIFTSGSTGVPKGVMISHKNIMANTDSIIEYLELTEADIIDIVLPFYYCFGLSLLHTHMRVGGSVVFNNSFTFIGSVINNIKNYKCTGFAGVPSHYQILLRKTKSFKTTEFPDLRYVQQAGGKLYEVFLKEFKASFPNVKFYVMYGQTEATARLSYLQPELFEEKLGSIGKGIPGVELDVVNEKNETVKPGEVGEIIARGDNIMLGYLNDEESTNKALRNGWLHTGDLATKDEDGFIYLTARKKEILKVGGNRISPKEIEEVLVTIPEVVDCTIKGVADDVLGEALQATIVVNSLKENPLSENDIKKYCSERLASHKIPHIIEFQEQVNVSATGKKVKG